MAKAGTSADNPALSKKAQEIASKLIKEKAKKGLLDKGKSKDSRKQQIAIALSEAKQKAKRKEA